MRRQLKNVWQDGWPNDHLNRQSCPNVRLEADDLISSNVFRGTRRYIDVACSLAAVLLDLSGSTLRGFVLVPQPTTPRSVAQPFGINSLRGV